MDDAGDYWLSAGEPHCAEGVPVKLPPDKLAAFPDAEYPTRYEKAVAYAHTARIPRERIAGLREE